MLTRARYTDFLVNEITPDGKVVHLTTLGPPKKPQPANASAEAPKAEEPAAKVEEVKAPEPEVKAPEAAAPAPAPPIAPEVAAAEFAITSEDEAILHGYFGTDVTAKIVKMYKHILSKPNEKAAVYGSIVSEPILDRELRTKLHQDMRRIFNSKLETSTDKDGYIKIFAAAKQRAPGPRGDMYANQKQPRNQQKGKLGWAELGGEHLHFSLYKENKDTMEVISYVSMRLGMKPRAFSFAGTKDRRGVTVQRVSTFRKNADQLAFLNKDMRGSRIGDFTYEKHGLELGDLTGNEFLITLRDCQFPGAENLDDASVPTSSVPTKLAASSSTATSRVPLTPSYLTLTSASRQAQTQTSSPPTESQSPAMTLPELKLLRSSRTRAVPRRHWRSFQESSLLRVSS